MGFWWLRLRFAGLDFGLGWVRLLIDYKGYCWWLLAWVYVGGCLSGWVPDDSGFVCCCVNVVWFRVVVGGALLVWCVLVILCVGFLVEL